MSEKYDALFNYFVDMLTDLADPADADREYVYEDMQQVVGILFEGASLDVIEDDSNSIKFTVTLWVGNMF